MELPTLEPPSPALPTLKLPTMDPAVLEAFASMTLATLVALAVREDTCPPSHPHGLQANHGDGGAQSQVTWMHNVWLNANSTSLGI